MTNYWFYSSSICGFYPSGVAVPNCPTHRTSSSYSPPPTPHITLPFQLFFFFSMCLHIQRHFSCHFVARCDEFFISTWVSASRHYLTLSIRSRNLSLHLLPHLPFPYPFTVILSSSLPSLTSSPSSSENSHANSFADNLLIRCRISQSGSPGCLCMS